MKSCKGGPRTCRQGRKTAAGSITVFFSLVLAIVIALVLMILESARIEGGRLYMTIAANSAIDSLFSQYHRKLWEEYRLLGLEHYAYDQITDEMGGFMKPYLEADNWFPMELDSVDISELRLLTEDAAQYYEQEVLDYMKYGISAEVWDLVTADSFREGILEGSSVGDLSDLYDDHAKEAMRLEKAIGNISDSLQTVEDERQRAQEALEECSGSGFISAAEAMRTELGRMPRLTESYLKIAEKLKTELEESRKRLDGDRDSGEITQATWEMMDKDISEYESYVSEDGERRTEIAGFPDRAEGIRGYLEGLIEEAREVEEYIEDWEPSEDEEGEEDELDVEALWAPVRAAFASCDRIIMNAKHGIEDEETEQKLESIETILKTNFLRLVLPEGAELSTEALKMEDKPSECCYAGTDESADSLADSLFYSAYTAGVMDYFGRGTYDEGSEKTGSGNLEVEYVLYGKENDTENLTETVKTLIGVRTGLNLIYLYSDSTRRSEARALAAAITGVLSLTPLLMVMTFFVMSVWALGQAVCDVRDLLGGGKVPFIHDSQSFYLTLTGLLEFASGKLGGNPLTESPERGLKYVDYLKILLFFSHDTGQDYRCMDVMQMNLRKSQKDFLMSLLIYALELDVHVRTGHVFSELGIVKAQGYGTEKNYRMEVSTAYSY